MSKSSPALLNLSGMSQSCLICLGSLLVWTEKRCRYCEMSSGEMTSSGRLALPTHPPDISKKRRGGRRMERQTGEREWGGGATGGLEG